ncbi:MAG: YveK family protein [Aeromicrobium sp.]
MTLRDYVLIVARSWIVVAATVAVGIVAAGIVALASTSMYTSSAQVLFTGHATTSGQDQAYIGNYVQSRMQTYKKLGTSANLMARVAETMRSDETPAELAGRIEVGVTHLTTVATITAKDTTAKGAARTADTAANALLDAVQDLEAETLAGATDGQDDQAAQATVEGVVSGVAAVPSSPSDPNLPLYLLAGALAGLAASIGVVALREVLRGEASSSPSSEET